MSTSTARTTFQTISNLLTNFMGSGREAFSCWAYTGATSRSKRIEWYARAIRKPIKIRSPFDFRTTRESYHPTPTKSRNAAPVRSPDFTSALLTGPNQTRELSETREVVETARRAVSTKQRLPRKTLLTRQEFAGKVRKER